MPCGLRHQKSLVSILTLQLRALEYYNLCASGTSAVNGRAGTSTSRVAVKRTQRASLGLPGMKNAINKSLLPSSLLFFDESWRKEMKPDYNGCWLVPRTVQEWGAGH